MQISELAKHFNVSVRTLQYYDNVGLLKPTEVTEKGYRFYDESSVSTMEKILQYKRFGFSLDSISKLLSEENPEKSGLRRDLLMQKRKYEKEIKRMNSVIDDIDKELAKPVKLDNWFDKIMKDYNHSRCTYSSEVGVCIWGKADYENDIDFTTSLRFPIGSVTTQFTAYCIIRFQELGLLRTDDYIGKYFPEMIYGDKVTIQHLLDMTSGFTNEFFDKKYSDEEWVEYREKICDLPYELQICRSYEYTYNHNKENNIIQSVSEIIEAANFTPLKFTPGEKYDWAEINYMILRIILEKISQKPLEEIFGDYIFTPLEMDNTTLYGSTDVVGYVDNMRIEHYDGIYGGACSVISTIDDMAKWYDFLIKEDFMARYIPADAEFSCGWFNNDDNYRHCCRPCEVDIEVSIDKEKDKDKDKYSNLFISVMNKRPIPDNHTRIMYYPIECDDGYFKVEVWEMFPDSEIKVTSIKVFDENAEELYSAPVPECGYFFALRNDGEKRNAEEFAEAGSYNYELNLSEILGSEFKPMSKYIVEVRAECTEYSIFGRSAMLGMVYKRKDEWISVAYYAFYCYDSAYDIFMEALNRVMNFWNDKFYNYLDEPENEDENENE